MEWWLLIVGIMLLLIFDFTNGFHDAANMVATAIASRAMSPGQAIAVVSVFTLLGPLLGGTAVANTVGGIADLQSLSSRVAIHMLLASTLGAILVNLATWFRGLPSSSSHALVGGLCGAGIMSAGADHIVWGYQELLETGQLAGLMKVIGALVISPPLGLACGFALQRGMRFFLRGARPTTSHTLRRLQWLTTSWLSFSHGANDAQKTMAMITLLLVVSGHLATFAVPYWVMVICAEAITLGTMFGGWKIIQTVGFGIYRLRPLHALSSQIASSMVISGAAALGGPVSTTHVVSSSIMGVGSAERPRAVRWNKALEIVFAWLFTLPASALIAALTYTILKVVLE